MTFDNLGLAPELIRAVTDLGFTAPTPIQKEAIPYLLNNPHDMIALAQTGTGKTAAFGLPLLQQIEPDTGHIQALILCPTRELCLQIDKDLKSYAKYLPAISVTPVYGGTSIDKQISALKRGTDIVVGTPGRVKDLIIRKKLHLNNVEMVVLDEADEMLSMGFKDDLDAILGETPPGKQTLLFSATMEKQVANIARNYMHDAKKITVGKQNTGAKDIAHEYYVVHAKDRYQALKRLVDYNPEMYGIVFCRTRRETRDVAHKLGQDGYNAEAIHGDLSQAQRDAVMNKFRNGKTQLLVATDVAARGIDVTDLTHVINYNLPDDNDVYIHRSGRTGRAGKSGRSITIVHSRETNRIKDLERKVGKPFDKKPVPAGRDICEKQLYNLIDKIEKTEIDEAQIGSYMPQIYKRLEWLSREEIIKHFVSAEFNRFLQYYKDAPDLNAKSERNGKSRSRNGISFSRFFINAGKRQNLNPGKLMTMINDHPALAGVEIGSIDIMKNFSFFEIDRQRESEVFAAFHKKKLGGVKLYVELSNPKKQEGGRKKRKKRYDRR